MNTRFKELYGKPKTLPDQNNECSAEATAYLARHKDGLGVPLAHNSPQG